MSRLLQIIILTGVILLVTEIWRRMRPSSRRVQNLRSDVEFWEGRVADYEYQMTTPDIARAFHDECQRAIIWLGCSRNKLRKALIRRRAMIKKKRGC